MLEKTVLGKAATDGVKVCIDKIYQAEHDSVLQDKLKIFDLEKENESIKAENIVT